MSTNVLPDKLSALIRVAVKDMQAAVAAGHLIDMDYWIEPLGDWRGDKLVPSGKCTVCMAGSVMLNTLGASASESSCPEWWDEDTARKLKALNEVRLGEYRYALSELDETLDWPGSDDLEDVKAIEEELGIFVAGDELDTDDKLREFCNTMEQVAARLEQLGF